MVPWPRSRAMASLSIELYEILVLVASSPALMDDLGGCRAPGKVHGVSQAHGTIRPETVGKRAIKLVLGILVHWAVGWHFAPTLENANHPPRETSAEEDELRSHDEGQGDEASSDGEGARRGQFLEE